MKRADHATEPAPDLGPEIEPDPQDIAALLAGLKPSRAPHPSPTITQTTDGQLTAQWAAEGRVGVAYPTPEPQPQVLLDITEERPLPVPADVDHPVVPAAPVSLSDTAPVEREPPAASSVNEEPASVDRVTVMSAKKPRALAGLIALAVVAVVVVVGVAGSRTGSANAVTRPTSVPPAPPAASVAVAAPLEAPRPTSRESSPEARAGEATVQARDVPGPAVQRASSAPVRAPRRATAVSPAPAPSAPEPPPSPLIRQAEL